MALNLSLIFLELCDAFFRKMNCSKELIVIYFVSVFLLLSSGFSLHKFNNDKKKKRNDLVLFETVIILRKHGSSTDCLMIHIIDYYFCIELWIFK